MDPLEIFSGDADRGMDLVFINPVLVAQQVMQHAEFRHRKPMCRWQRCRVERVVNNGERHWVQFCADMELQARLRTAAGLLPIVGKTMFGAITSQGDCSCGFLKAVVPELLIAASSLSDSGEFISD